MWNVCKFPDCENYTARPDGDMCESHRRLTLKAEEQTSQTRRNDMKPNYINKEIKKISREDLLKALKEVNRKNEENRRQMIIDTNKALVDGFRCTPNFHNF